MTLSNVDREADVKQGEQYQWDVQTRAPIPALQPGAQPREAVNFRGGSLLNPIVFVFSQQRVSESIWPRPSRNLSGLYLATLLGHFLLS
jgi:hypothetical protein